MKKITLTIITLFLIIIPISIAEEYVFRPGHDYNTLMACKSSCNSAYGECKTANYENRFKCGETESSCLKDCETSTFIQKSLINETIQNETKSNSTTCRDGFVYNSQTKVCDPKVEGVQKVKMYLTTKNFDPAKDKLIEGYIEYSCEGQCQGQVVGLDISYDGPPGITFDIEYDKEKYMTASNNKLNFKINVNGIERVGTKLKSITIKESNAGTIVLQVSAKPLKVKIKVDSTQPIPYNQYATIVIDVDGPEDTEYTYQISTPLAQGEGFRNRGGFTHDGEVYSVAGFFTQKNNKAIIMWTPPEVSRKVKYSDMLILDTVQGVGELGTTASKGLISMLTGYYLGKTLEKKGYSKEEIEKITNTYADAEEFLLDSYTDGFWETTETKLDEYLNGKSNVEKLEDSLKEYFEDKAIIYDAAKVSYETYIRANERFNAYNSNKWHTYTFNVEIIVMAEGYSSVEKTIPIRVYAPEVILE